MTDDSPKDVVRAYLTAFNERDREQLASLLAEDVIEHGVQRTMEGHDELVEYLDGHYDAFPDYSGETHEMHVDDDIVTVRYTARGTHTGTYQDVEPTGLEASWTGIAMYRVEDGEIAEIWIEEDRLGLLEQLELVDTTEPAHLRL